MRGERRFDHEPQQPDAGKSGQERPGLRPQAPLVSTNAVNGKGGGMMPSAATASPRCWLTRCSTRFNVDGLISRASPCSPALRPIQNVAAAPGHRTGGGQQGVQPEKLRLARRHDDHDEVDPERQKEHQRGIERPHQEHPARCEKVAEQ